MNTDAYFTIGKTHDVCEDYAVAGQTENGLGYAIVSDGCSSSPRTDFGARFLATAAEVYIRMYNRMPSGDVIISNADAARKVLGLPQTCLDATLLVVTMDEYEVNISMWGDGEAVILCDAGYHHVSVDYKHGAPKYLSYDLNPSRKEIYRRDTEHGMYTKTETSTVDKVYNYKGTQAQSPLELRNIQPIGETRGVLLFSDGLQTFQDSYYSNEAVPVPDVLEQVLALKNLKGEYLKRRCKKFLGKFCRDNSWHHADDFSVAGIMR